MILEIKKYGQCGIFTLGCCVQLYWFWIFSLWQEAKKRNRFYLWNTVDDLSLFCEQQLYLGSGGAVNFCCSLFLARVTHTSVRDGVKAVPSLARTDCARGKWLGIYSELRSSSCWASLSFSTNLQRDCLQSTLNLVPLNSESI